MCENGSLLLSIQPSFANDILSGRKTVELRRVCPTVTPGSLAYIYASAPEQALLGVFRIERVVSQPVGSLWEKVRDGASISKNQFETYFNGVVNGHAIFIGNARNLSEPITLRRLQTIWPGFRPPQSFRYLRKSNVQAAILMSTVQRLLALEPNVHHQTSRRPPYTGKSIS